MGIPHPGHAFVEVRVVDGLMLGSHVLPGDVVECLAASTSCFMLRNGIACIENL